MRATTIKLEYPLLREVQHVIPKSVSLSAFVRTLLEKEVLRQKMIDASDAYCRFMESNANEKAWLEDWEQAELGAPPKMARKRRRKAKR